MKKSIINSFLLISLFTPAAFADQSAQPVSAESLEILEAVSHCASTVELLASSSRVIGAKIKRYEDLTLYIVNYGTGGYPPNFNVEITGTLKVTRTFERSNNKAPDAPGGEMIFRCFNAE